MNSMGINIIFKLIFVLFSVIISKQLIDRGALSGVSVSLFSGHFQPQDLLMDP